MLVRRSTHFSSYPLISVAFIPELLLSFDISFLHSSFSLSGKTISFLKILEYRIMPDLSDAIWQGIGVVVGTILSILTLIISVVLYKRSQGRKLLVWDIQHISTLSMF